MEIDLVTLKQATNELFFYLESNKISKIQVKQDYYWKIKKDKKYDLETEPTNKDIEISRLSYEWDLICKMAREDIGPVGHGLVWLGSLYQYIGENVP